MNDRTIQRHALCDYPGPVTHDDVEASSIADLVDTLFTVMPRVADHITKRLESLGMTSTDYWALRSVDGPMPTPSKRAAGGINQRAPTLAANMAMAAAARQIWLDLSGPNRMIALPDALEAKKPMV